MFLSGSIHKANLATLHSAAVDRADRLERSVRFARNDEEALGLAIEHARFLALAGKLGTAICERPVFLTLDDIERSIEALTPVHRAKARSLDRRTFRELDELMDQLKALCVNLEPEEY